MKGTRLGTVGIGRPRAVGERALGGGGIGQCRKVSALRGSPQTGNGVSSLAVGTWGGLGLLVGMRYARRSNRHRGTEPLPGRHSPRVGLLSRTEFCAIFQIKPEFFSTVPFCLFFPLSPRPWLPACVQLHPHPRCQPVWFPCHGAKCPSWNSSSLPTPGHKPTGRSVPRTCSIPATSLASPSPHIPQPRPCLWDSPDPSHSSRLRRGVRGAQVQAAGAHRGLPWTMGRESVQPPHPELSVSLSQAWSSRSARQPG